MKLKATANALEIVSPMAWENIKKAIITAGRAWGTDISIDDDLTMRDAIARFWAAYRIQEDARLTAPEDV